MCSRPVRAPPAAHPPCCCVAAGGCAASCAAKLDMATRWRVSAASHRLCTRCRRSIRRPKSRGRGGKCSCAPASPPDTEASSCVQLPSRSEQTRAADNRAALNCLRGAPPLQHGGAQGGGCRRPGWWRAAWAARPQSYTRNSKVRAEKVIECGVGTGQRQQKGRRAAVQVRRRAKQTGERRAARRGGTRRRESERNNLDAGRGAGPPLACEAMGGNLHGARGCAASRIALDLGDTHPLAAEGTIHQPVVQERWGESHCWPSAASVGKVPTQQQPPGSTEHLAPGGQPRGDLVCSTRPSRWAAAATRLSTNQTRQALTCTPKGTRGSPGSRSRRR